MATGERLQEYMIGWNDYHRGRSTITEGGADYERGYAAGRAAYLAAEQAERERLERCPTCGGWTWTWWQVHGGDCPACHGTDKREVTP